MRNHRILRRFAALSVAVLLVAACSGGGAEDQEIQPLPSSEDDDASSTADEGEPDDDAEVEGHAAASEDEGDESQPDTDTEVDEEVDSEIDVTVIPDEITPEYVEAVLAELEQLYADALRELMLAGEPTIEVTDRLGSAFSEPQYQARLDEFLEIFSEERQILAEPEDLTPRRHEVQVLHEASDDCIYVETIADGSGISRLDLEPVPAFVLLGPPDVERPGNRNETPWIIYSMPLGDVEELRADTPCSQ